MNHSLIIMTDVCQVISEYLVDLDKNKYEKHLEFFIDSAIDRDDYSFNTGLIGAGWLISFFHKNEVIEDDIDEILFDFDDNFYKLAMKAVVDTNNSYEEILHLIHYFQQRIQNKSTQHNFYRRFTLFETIRLLTEKLSSQLRNNTLTRNQEIEVLLKLSYLSPQVS
jgi:hypothetical protein